MAGWYRSCDWINLPHAGPDGRQKAVLSLGSMTSAMAVAIELFSSFLHFSFFFFGGGQPTEQ